MTLIATDGFNPLYSDIRVSLSEVIIVLKYSGLHPSIAIVNDTFF